MGVLAEIGGRLGIPGSYFPAQSGLGSASGRGLGCARLCSNGGPGVLGWRATRGGSGGGLALPRVSASFDSDVYVISADPL